MESLLSIDKQTFRTIDRHSITLKKEVGVGASFGTSVTKGSSLLRIPLTVLGDLPVRSGPWGKRSYTYGEVTSVLSLYIPSFEAITDRYQSTNIVIFYYACL